MSYKLKYTGQKVQELLEQVNNGQGGGGAGVDALIYRSSINVNSRDSKLPFSSFNRTPKVGDYFIALYTYFPGAGNNPRIANIEITAVNNETQMASISVSSQTLVKGDKGDKGSTGEKGDTGSAALVWGGPAISLSGVDRDIHVDTTYFNRTPASGDSFMALGSYTIPARGDYICVLKVKSVDLSSSQATCSYPSLVYNIKGDKGDQGHRGIQGIQGEKGERGERGSQGPMGVQGDRGPIGITPSIRISASVDGNIGVPSVAVSKSGTDESPFFTFTFKNIKGAKGDKGDVGVPLELNSSISLSSVFIGAQKLLESSDFNRTPVTGEEFSTTLIETETQYLYYTRWRIGNQNPGNDNYWWTKLINFYLMTGPQGPKGDTGATGTSGADGANGANGTDGVGISSASVKSVEETEEYTSTTVSFTKTDSTTSDVVIKAKNAINPNTVSFIGTVTADMWQDSTTYSTYGYKYSALMPFTGGAYATDTYVPDIVPSVVSDIASGNFAPFANSLSTGVQVYAKSKPTATTNFNVSLSHVQ